MKYFALIMFIALQAVFIAGAGHHWNLNSGVGVLFYTGASLALPLIFNIGYKKAASSERGKGASR